MPLHETISDALARWERVNPPPAEGELRTYLSTPINNGPRFVEWWRSAGCRLEAGSAAYDAAHAAAVREPNSADARAVAEQLEAAGRGAVVNPIDFQEPTGWDQSTFHTFWTEVIRLFIDQLVFVDGWEFSRGCCREFSAALAKSVPCFDQRGAPMTLAIALELIGHARDTLTELGLDTTDHDNVLACLQQCQTEKGVR